MGVADAYHKVQDLCTEFARKHRKAPAMQTFRPTIFAMLTAAMVVAGPLWVSGADAQSQAQSHAQSQAQSRYGSWRQEPDKLGSIIQDLRNLIDEADRARAAGWPRRSGTTR